MKNSKKQKGAIASIKSWDFDSSEKNGNRYSHPIPISYSGGMKISKLEALMASKDLKNPLFSGNTNAIYCQDVILAIEFINNGHEFLPHLRQEFLVH